MVRGLRSSSLFVAASLVIACGGRTGLGSLERDASIDASPQDAASHDAGLDVASDAPDDVGPGLCPVPPDAGGPPFPDACGSSLFAGSITPSSSTCFLDLAVKEGENGALTVFCKGGYATAIFSKGPFEGSYDAVSDFVDVCFGTTFTYSDGCTWGSAQRISGTLGTRKLAFTYSESVISGTGCASPCSASGEIDVQ